MSAANVFSQSMFHFKLLITLGLTFTNLNIAQAQSHSGVNNRPVIPAVGKEVSIVAVGDVMLGSWVTPILEEKGSDYPFIATKNILQSSDATIANLEAPFTLDGEPFEKTFNFKVPPRFATGLLESGINIVNLANNHTLDYGLPGLAATLKTLSAAGIRHSGAGMSESSAFLPAMVQVNGLKIAFFGYSMTFPTEFYAKADTGGTAYPEPELMQAMIQEWENKVDFIVASFHWGAEKWQIPKDYQIHFAHLAIDSGADLVIGHHPHVLQGLEIYKNRLIAYSLGNFAFGSYSRYSIDSIILKVYLREEGLFTALCYPINVDNREVEFQPVVVGGERGAAIIARLREISAPLNDGLNIIRDSGLIYGKWVSFYDQWLLTKAIDGYWKSPNISTELLSKPDSQN